MTTESFKNRGLPSLSVSSSFNRVINLLRRLFLISLLAGLVSLSGTSTTAMAAPAVLATPETALQVVESPAQTDRILALVACLPKRLSQSSFKQAWSEMGNDQVERILHLTDNPKLSEAETELKDCLNRKGFKK